MGNISPWINSAGVHSPIWIFYYIFLCFVIQLYDSGRNFPTLFMILYQQFPFIRLWIFPLSFEFIIIHSVYEMPFSICSTSRNFPFVNCLAFIEDRLPKSMRFYIKLSLIVYIFAITLRIENPLSMRLPVMPVPAIPPIKNFMFEWFISLDVILEFWDRLWSTWGCQLSCDEFIILRPVSLKVLVGGWNIRGLHDEFSYFEDESFTGVLLAAGVPHHFFKMIL